EELDRRLNEMPAEERDRYYATLRRYAAWVQSLPPERREALRTMSPDERLALVRQSRAEANSEHERESAAVFFQSTVLSPIGLFESAFLLRTWFQLSPDEKATVVALKPLEQKIQRLEALGAEHRVYHDYSPIREEFESLKKEALPPNAVGKARIGKL